MTDQNEAMRSIMYKANRSLESTMPSLKERGYLDDDHKAIGAGIHLMPLLHRTFIASETISDMCADAFTLDHEENEPSHDPSEVMKIFHVHIQEAIKGLEQDECSSPKDTAFELIFPHMNWVFCMHYAHWCAQMSLVDIMMNDPAVLDEGILEDPISMLGVFLKHTRQTGAIWSTKITERALDQIGNPHTEKQVP